MTVFKNSAERQQWTKERSAAIGQRLQAELERLQLDLTPHEHLCQIDVALLAKGSSQAALLRADFLSLLADLGVDVRHVLTGR